MSFRFDPALPLDAETRRIAGEQIDKAIGELSRPQRGEDLHEAIHEARKRFKKLRALFRLVHEGDGDAFDAANHLYRAIARTLSSVRDRTALIEALDALEADLGSASSSESFAVLRTALERKRDAALSQEFDLDERVAGTIAALEKSRDGLVELAFDEPEEDAAAIVSSGYGETHAKARRMLKRAEKHRDPEDLHALRRHVKYLGFHLGLLAPLWPEAFAPLKQAAAEIADALGRDHDYALLRAEMRSEPASFGAAKHRDAVLALLMRRQQELQGRALHLARRLLSETSRPAARRIERLWEEAARASRARDEAGENARQTVSDAAA